ncbi:hypothetical protein [Burkholderia ubonensis]|uniref:hypothetical protein n=1 Tax=Burkholderia ubonensis TaxID=101571 RepID=UPI002ABD2578|nr:hypothetical protein [Burkholderia ubonensis]
MTLSELEKLMRRLFAVDEHRVYYRTNTNLAVCEWADRASAEAAPPMGIRDKYGLIGLAYPEGAVRLGDPSTES